jgi:sirohydrochlorin ferrochelatase
VRDPRLSRPLVLAAHGSTDPRFGEVVEAIAAQLCRLRPELDVRVGYLDHGPPSIADVVDESCIVVPLLLSGGYHVRVDIPEQAKGCVVAGAVGPDQLLASALADRLREAGYDGISPVVVAGAGSSDERALDDVRTVASALASQLDVAVTTAFVSAGTPTLSDIEPAVVASYLLAPGKFHDAVVAAGAPITSEPIGAHPAVAEIVLNRYDAAQVPGRTAPA